MRCSSTVLSHRLWQAGFKWLARFISHLGALAYRHRDPSRGDRSAPCFFIDHGMGVVIGETAEIGDDCTLYHGVTLGGTSWNEGQTPPTLGNGVVVGAGAKILGPIEIGDGREIGSNAVVVKAVPGGRDGDRHPRAHRRRHTEAEDGRFAAYAVARDATTPGQGDPASSSRTTASRRDRRLERLVAELERLETKAVRGTRRNSIELLDPNVDQNTRVT